APVARVCVHTAPTGAGESETGAPAPPANSSYKLTRVLSRASGSAGQVTSVVDTPGVGAVRNYAISYDADQMFPISFTDPTGLATSSAWVSALGTPKATQVGIGPVSYASFDYFGRA